MYTPIHTHTHTHTRTHTHTHTHTHTPIHTQHTPQVHTKLSNPTPYHVNAVKQRQVHQFLSSQGIMLPQSRSAPSQNTVGLMAPRGNMTSYSMQKDPMLSGAMNTSPLKPSPLNPPAMAVGGGGMYGSQPTSLNVKSESPTMMVTDTPEDVRGRERGREGR